MKLITCLVCKMPSYFDSHCNMCNGNRACHNCTYCKICKRGLPPQIGIAEWICIECGDLRFDAMQSETLCANCSFKGERKLIDECPICQATNVPSEQHHIAGRKNNDLTIEICLNCHRVLTRKQETYWPRHYFNEEAFKRGINDIYELIRRCHNWHVDYLFSGRITLKEWILFNRPVIDTINTLSRNLK